MSALIHRSCIAINVIAGAPACANCPTSVRRSVTRPPAAATTLVRARSSSAFSIADRALTSCALLSPASPAVSTARRRSAAAASSWLRALIRSARAISTRRTEMAPGSSVKICSIRFAFCSVLMRLAWAACSEAVAAATAAFEPLTDETHRLVVGPAALERDPVGNRIDIEQCLSGPHFVIVLHVDLHDLARYLGCHRHHEGLDPGLGGVRRQPVRDEIPGEARDDQ